MTSLRRAAARLRTGSALLARGGADRAAAWCRKSYRDDLTGWKAALGPAVRVLLLSGAGWLLVRIVRARPTLMWVLAAGWLIAAWRATRKTPAEAAEDEPEEGPAAPDPNAVRQLLVEAIGDRPGVHLSTLLAHLQEHGQGEGWTVADLRARLEALKVPVRRSVKVAGRVAYGVHRDDLPKAAEAPSPADAADQAA